MNKAYVAYLCNSSTVETLLDGECYPRLAIVLLLRVVDGCPGTTEYLSTPLCRTRDLRLLVVNLTFVVL